MDRDWVDVSPIENGDIPASYVSLLEGKQDIFRQQILFPAEA